MPYSKKQKVAACIALRVKEGKMSKSKLKGTSLSMYNSMSKVQLEDYCKSKIKK